MNTNCEIKHPEPVVVDNNLLYRFQQARLDDKRGPFSISQSSLMRIEQAVNKTNGLTYPVGTTANIPIEQFKEMLCIELALLLLDKRLSVYSFYYLSSYCEYCANNSFVSYQQNGTFKLLLQHAAPEKDPRYPPLWAYEDGTWGWELCVLNVKPDLKMLLDGKKGRETLMPYIEKYNAVNSKSSGACFIATACYGSTFHPSVQLLRQYRDGVLSHHLAGRLFIRLYYYVSPSISRWLRKRAKIKNYIRIRLLEPIVKEISKRPSRINH